VSPFCVIDFLNSAVSDKRREGGVLNKASAKIVSSRFISGLREGEIIYIKQRQISLKSFGCQSEKFHVVNCKNGLSVIAIN
jgi:hypothetical protein